MCNRASCTTGAMKKNKRLINNGDARQAATQITYRQRNLEVNPGWNEKYFRFVICNSN